VTIRNAKPTDTECNQMMWETSTMATTLIPNLLTNFLRRFSPSRSTQQDAADMGTAFGLDAVMEAAAANEVRSPTRSAVPRRTWPFRAAGPFPTDH
jgi:hypothetical protein